MLCTEQNVENVRTDNGKKLLQKFFLFIEEDLSDKNWRSVEEGYELIVDYTKKVQNKRGFTKDSNESFLMSWCRIVSKSYSIWKMYYLSDGNGTSAKKSYEIMDC